MRQLRQHKANAQGRKRNTSVLANLGEESIETKVAISAKENNFREIVTNHSTATYILSKRKHSNMTCNSA